MMKNEVSGPVDKISETLRRISGAMLRVIAITLLVYILGIGIYSYLQYSNTRDLLLSHGVSDATASLLATVVLLIALGLPCMSYINIIMRRAKSIDLVSVLALPFASWLISFIPANFDAVSSQALKYCAVRPDGRLFCLDHAGVDPITRAKLRPMDAETAEIEFRRQNGIAPKSIGGGADAIQFFDPVTGRAKVFVAKNDFGCFDLFDNPGVHPQTGERLLPVTKDLTREIRACKKNVLPGSAVSGTQEPHVSLIGRQDEGPKINGAIVGSADAVFTTNSKSIIGAVGDRYVFRVTPTKASPPIELADGVCSMVGNNLPGLPDQPDFIVEVRGATDPGWKNLNKICDVGPRRCAQGPGMVRARSADTGELEVFISIRAGNSC